MFITFNMYLFLSFCFFLDSEKRRLSSVDRRSNPRASGTWREIQLSALCRGKGVPDISEGLSLVTEHDRMCGG